jgi:hypothetical protein
MIKLKNILKEWSEVNTGPKRWFKPYGDKYTEFEKATNHTNKELKESGQLDMFKPIRKYNTWNKSMEDKYVDAAAEYPDWFPTLDTDPQMQKTWYGRIERYDYKGLATFIKTNADLNTLARSFGVKDIDDFAKFIVSIM